MPYQHWSFSQQCERIPLKNKTKQKKTKQNKIGGFMLKSNEKPHWLFLPRVWIFPSLVNLSRESPVTRTTPIYHGKSVPYNRTYYWMSSRSLYSVHVFLFFIILKIPVSPAHICCWYTTQRSNAIQHNSLYLHQHIPCERNQASSCYMNKKWRKSIFQL